MFKKREKSGNTLKRSLEDRYQDESGGNKEAEKEEHETYKRVKH